MKRLKGKRLFSDSIFTSTLVLLFLMMVGTLVVVWLFFSQNMEKNHEAQLREVNRSQLSQVYDDVENRLKVIERSMGQVLFSKNGMTFATIAGKKYSDNGSRMVADLSSFVSENPLIKSAEIYLPTTDEVLSADGKITSLKSCENRRIIWSYLMIRENGRDVTKEVSSRCILENGQLYLVSDLCVPYFIGAMVVGIDMKELDFCINRNHAEKIGEFYLFDTEGKVILGDIDLCKEAETYLRDGQYENVENNKRNPKSRMFVAHSADHLITYGLIPSDSMKKMSSKGLMLTFLPFLIIYGILSMLYSIYISRRIYRPINRLMNITMGQREELEEIRRDRSRNEMEYLEQVFQDTWGENEQNRLLLANISQDVLEQMFRSILSGRNMDKSYIADTMRGLGMEQLINGRFVVASIWINGKEERERSSMESGIYRRSMLNFLNHYPSTSCMHQGFYMEQDVLAIVVSFSESTSALQIKRTMEEFTEALMQYTKELPFSILIGTSKTTQEIINLRAAYHEAYTQMEYLRYVAEAEVEQESSEPDENRENRGYYREFTNRLIECAEKDNREESEQLINGMVEELSPLGGAEWLACVNSIIDVLMEQMIAIHVSSEEMKTIRSYAEKTLEVSEGSAREDYFYNTLNSAAKLIFANNRKSRYRYVDVAKDYISAHYSDGNLSLNEVSDAVGISAPYLSGIFAESEHVGFSAYLSNYRVEQAKQFLAQTTQNVTDIGYKCGFNSAQSFSRVFKKNTGYTPGQYREYCRERMIREDSK